MQNPEECANGLLTTILEYIQKITLYANLRIYGKCPFCCYKIPHRLTKMSQALFCSYSGNRMEEEQSDLQIWSAHQCYLPLSKLKRIIGI